MKNHPLTRRHFLAGSVAAGASTLLLPTAQVLGANERLNVGVIGLGGRGGGGHKSIKGSHLDWAEKSGARVIAVSDCDPFHMNKADKLDHPVAKHQDFRKLLEMKDVDAVIIATPNHWHALGTILSCQAGKDVFIEKPASHSIWEGRKMVEAARKYKRMVQIGTQQRSDPALIELKHAIAAKELGEVQWIHALWFAHRMPIGRTTTPTPVDPKIYDLWCGPRRPDPMMRQKLHYDWHWFWDYGNGDMGNRVVHNIDDVHHVMQMNGNIPTRAMAFGGRFGYDDDAETPNTQSIWWDWKAPIIASNRNLPFSSTRKSSSVYSRFNRNHRFTNIVKCENGFFAVTRGGGKVYDNDGNEIRKIKGDGGGAHMRNFFDACKSRNHNDLNADVEQGHLAAVMLHMGNNSFRIGQQVTADQIAERISGCEEAAETFKQMTEHLEKNGIDLKIDKPTLGPWVTFDPKTERFTGDHADRANPLVRENYREPFVIPERV